MYYLYKTVSFNEVRGCPSAACIVFEPLRFSSLEQANYTKDLLSIVNHTSYDVIDDDTLDRYYPNIVLDEVPNCSFKQVDEPDTCCSGTVC